MKPTLLIEASLGKANYNVRNLVLGVATRMEGNNDLLFQPNSKRSSLYGKKATNQKSVMMLAPVGIFTRTCAHYGRKFFGAGCPALTTPAHNCTLSPATLGIGNVDGAAETASITTVLYTISFPFTSTREKQLVRVLPESYYSVALIFPISST